MDVEETATPEEEVEATPEVVVEITPDDEEAVEVDAGDQTVIVEAPVEESEAIEAVVISETIDQAERIAALEADNARLYGEILAVSAQADEATALAESAVESQEADAEVINENFQELDNAEIADTDGDGDEEIVADIQPVTAKTHPLFRSFKDWRNR